MNNSVEKKYFKTFSSHFKIFPSGLFINIKSSDNLGAFTRTFQKFTRLCTLTNPIILSKKNPVYSLPGYLSACKKTKTITTTVKKTKKRNKKTNK